MPTPTVEPWGEFGAEPEDRKPDLTYLNGRGPSYPPPSPAPGDPYSTGWSQGQSAGVNGNGLNTHGKRPREEDGYGYGYGNGGENGGEMALAEEVGFVAGAADDPIVYGIQYSSLCRLLLTNFSVNGQSMKFSEVTEDHHELMTADEYTAYFEVYQAREG